MTSKKKDDRAAPSRSRKRRQDGKAVAKLAQHHESQDEQLQRLTALTETNRQLRRKIFDLYTIFEISRNFNSVLNYESLLDSFIFTLLAQVGAAKGAVFLRQNTDPDRYHFVKGKGSGAFPGKEMYFESGSKLLDYLTRLNRPVITEDVISELALKSERAILECFHPGVVVPLIYQARLSGLVLVSDKISGHSFSPDDIEFLSILGNQISVAIENARLYEAERKATRQLRAAQDQLVASERLAALGEMSAKVAHEINNPLGIIKNYLLLVRRSLKDNVEARNYTDIVSQEISRIARIVRELLDFHRPNGVAFQKLDVVDLIEDILQLVSQRLERHRVEVIRRYVTERSRIEGSPDNLKQVFLNLVLNACDAMKDGGKLVISVEQDENEMTIRFCDTGPGIPADIVPRIFEPFFTTKQPGQGTGLGLSVCYGIIKRHSGTITYTNTDSGGCFEIRLPLAGKQRDDGDGSGKNHHH
jgi:signal transduction histidine kinase